MAMARGWRAEKAWHGMGRGRLFFCRVFPFQPRGWAMEEKSTCLVFHAKEGQQVSLFNDYLPYSSSYNIRPQGKAIVCCNLFLIASHESEREAEKGIAEDRAPSDACSCNIFGL